MTSGRLIVPGYMPALDLNGDPSSGAKIYVYLNRTTTPASVYADDALTTPLPNPVVANNTGQFVAIWADAGAPSVPLLYTVVAVDASGSPLGSPNAFDDLQPTLALDTISAMIAAAVAVGTTNVTSTPQGRLTLTTALAVTTSDVTAAGAIYYTPTSGAMSPSYNGVTWTASLIAELSLVLDSNSGHAGYHQSGKNFDLFTFLNPAAALGSGPAWSSDTARGTGAGTTELERFNGLWVNKNAITLRFGASSGNTVSVPARQATYVGTFRTTANGQTEDSVLKRFVWNAYNRKSRGSAVLEATDSWTYTTAAFRQANGSAANALLMVRGLDEDSVRADVHGNASNAGGAAIAVGIGVDSTTTSSSQLMPIVVARTDRTDVFSTYVGYPGLGLHSLNWLEFSAASGTTTWYGDNGSASNEQCGMVAQVMA